jgi:hypothetical protein
MDEGMTFVICGATILMPLERHEDGEQWEKVIRLQNMSHPEVDTVGEPSSLGR